MARLVGDQLQQHELQLARVEDAPPPAAASFAMLAVAAEAVPTAMAEMPAAPAMIGRELECVGLVRSGVTGPPAEAASAVTAIVAAPVAPALVVAVGGVGESHLHRSFMFRHV